MSNQVTLETLAADLAELKGLVRAAMPPANGVPPRPESGDRRGTPIRPAVPLTVKEHSAAGLDVMAAMAADPFFCPAPGSDWRPHPGRVMDAVGFGKIEDGRAVLDVAGLAAHFKTFAQRRFPGGFDAAYRAYKEDHQGPADATQEWIFGASASSVPTPVTPDLPRTLEPDEIRRRATDDEAGRPSWRGHRTLPDAEGFRAKEKAVRDRALSFCLGEPSYAACDQDLVVVLVSTGLHIPAHLRTEASFGATVDADPRRMRGEGGRPMTLKEWVVALDRADRGEAVVTPLVEGGGAA